MSTKSGCAESRIKARGVTDCTYLIYINELNFSAVMGSFKVQDINLLRVVLCTLFLHQLSLSKPTRTLTPSGATIVRVNWTEEGVSSARYITVVQLYACLV